jgi:hypothetical protein
MPPTSKNVTKEVGTTHLEAKLRLNPVNCRLSDPTFASSPSPARSVQAEKSLRSYGGTAMRYSAKPNRGVLPRDLGESKHHRGDISEYGQDSKPTTRRLAIMNLAPRGIQANFGKENADTFPHVQHPDLRTE